MYTVLKTKKIVAEDLENLLDAILCALEHAQSLRIVEVVKDGSTVAQIFSRKKSGILTITTYKNGSQIGESVNTIGLPHAPRAAEQKKNPGEIAVVSQEAETILYLC